MVIEFAKKLAKKYGLVDITNNRKQKFKYRFVIGVSERYLGKGKLVLASDDVDVKGRFHTEYATKLWVKHKIMNEGT